MSRSSGGEAVRTHVGPLLSNGIDCSHSWKPGSGEAQSPELSLKFEPMQHRQCGHSVGEWAPKSVAGESQNLQAG